MERKSLRVTVAVLLIGFAVGLTGTSCKGKAEVGKVPHGTPAAVPDKVEAYRKSIEKTQGITVAKVNGVNIAMSDLITEMNEVAPSYLKPGEERNPDIDKKVRDEALENLIRDTLVYQEAKRQGIKVPPKMVDEELKKIKAGMKSEEAYTEHLSRSGVTEKDVKENIARDLIFRMVFQKEVLDKVKVARELVRQTYEREKASYKGPSGQMSFEEARPLIEQKLMTEAVQKREDAWIKGLKKNARIEISLGEKAKAIQGVY
jgi:hypothetical protein